MKREDIERIVENAVPAVKNAVVEILQKSYPMFKKMFCEALLDAAAEHSNPTNELLCVRTQNDLEIVPVRTFSVFNYKEGGCCIHGIAHSATGKGLITLGVYSSIERAMEIYNEMLKYPIDEIYRMPPNDTVAGRFEG